MRRRTRAVLASLGAFAIGAGVTVIVAAPWSSKGARAERRATPRSTPIVTAKPPDRLGIFASWVRLENAKPGTADWNLTAEAPGEVEGYADTVSAQQGDTVTLFVSTIEPSFHVEAYRMGWYQGLGGRLVSRSAEIPGVKQRAPTVGSSTSMVETHWQPSIQIPLGAQYPPGTYLLKLVTANNFQQWVPLTVRDDKSTAAFFVVNAVTTWQAYNEWGGCSLYVCHGKGDGGRSKVVSFDRPYALGAGAGDFVGNELPLIRRMEEWGLDVTYSTDVDLHRHPERVPAHRALVSLGHDEYWSKAMRDGVEAARDKGVNLAFFGANAIYRQIRFEPSDLGPDRHEVNYRSRDDPIRHEDPSQTTVSFRESPVSRPESTLIGEQYECNPVQADMIVGDPSAWIYEGTGLEAGGRLDTVIGSEYDRYQPGPGVPGDVQVFAHSPVKCQGRSSFSDMTYYTAPSGAGVFATGTNYWVSKHDPPGPGSAYNPAVILITQNVLKVFGAGPAGRTHPSVGNTKDLPSPRREPQPPSRSTAPSQGPSPLTEAPPTEPPTASTEPTTTTTTLPTTTTTT
jgi:hypothetical protein